MNLAEKFTTIADNRPKLYKKGASDFGTHFDVSGADIVSIDKVHPKEHDVEVTTDAESVTVLGGNFIPFPYRNMSAEHNGVTFTVNDDGTVTANGTATAQAYIIISNKDTLKLSNGTYCLSGVTSKNNEDKKCYITYANVQVNSEKSGVIEITDSTGQNFLTCVVSAGKTVENFVFKPMLSAGTKAPGFEKYKNPVTYPVTDGKAIVKSVSPTMNIKAVGANINAKGFLDGEAVINELTQAIVDLGGEI